MMYAQDHPTLGSGYGSFWNIGAKSPVYYYTHTWVKELGNGHNGYLDLFVQLGAPGLALAVIATVIAPSFKLLASQRISRGRGATLAAMLFFCIGHNLTESSMLDRDMIVQVFLMLTLALIAVETRPLADRARPLYWAWVKPPPKRLDPVSAETKAHGGEV